MGVDSRNSISGKTFRNKLIDHPILGWGELMKSVRNLLFPFLVICLTKFFFSLLYPEASGDKISDMADTGGNFVGTDIVNYPSAKD
jgi:hypothetical protein